jgi:hypothetical protein
VACTARSRIEHWIAETFFRYPSDQSSSASGFFLMVPSHEHGASTSVRSNTSKPKGCIEKFRASRLVTAAQVTPRRSRLNRSADSRPRLRSFATSVPESSMSAAR